MKLVFFIAAVILAFIATFIALAGSAGTDGRGRWLDVNFFAGAFLCYLLSQAPFVGG
jgi:hypothetical protein